MRFFSTRGIIFASGLITGIVFGMGQPFHAVEQFLLLSAIVFPLTLFDIHARRRHDLSDPVHAAEMMTQVISRAFFSLPRFSRPDLLKGVLSPCWL